MDELLSELVMLEEDILYITPAVDGEPEFSYEPGTVPVLLSAPHAASHTRQGVLKEEDEYTGGLVRLVARLSGGHAIYARRKSMTDPNWYPDAPYKELLKRIILESEIRFVMDIHGAASDHAFGIAIGTAGGTSCPRERPMIIQALQKFGLGPDQPRFEKLDLDNIFPAKKKGTITHFAWYELGCPAAQFEINGCLRTVQRRGDASNPETFRGDPARIINTVQALTYLVQVLGLSSLGEC